MKITEMASHNTFVSDNSEALAQDDWGSILERGMSFMSLIMMGEDEGVIEEERR